MTDTVTIARIERAEHKIAGFEQLAFDFADMLNKRTERYDAEFAEIRSRLNLIDRAVSMLQNDVRDLRMGVTAQLNAQDQRLAALEQRMSGLEQHLTGQDHRLTGLEQRLTGLEQGLTGVDRKLDAILAKLA